ncbi:staygreen family protein [Neobacillus pocheonensis]|uniref:Staygreen family protein n=1 Tax=Neobacillus pocheonensis TaxID=363869 RepID=A0ABT0WGD4_9BACI|nr:staygreen family protein [Neobacillus pocheonensis]
MTHSDITGELFLSIGCSYNLSVINKNLRDEFLAEWISLKGHYLLRGKVYVSGGEFDESTSIRRFQIFQREATLALTAIIYADRKFFTLHPNLSNSPIFIQFNSTFPQLNQELYYGTPRQYIN